MDPVAAALRSAASWDRLREFGDEIGKHRLQIAQQWKPRSRHVDFFEVDLGTHDACLQRSGLHDDVAARPDDLRAARHAFSPLEPGETGIDDEDAVLAC